MTRPPRRGRLRARFGQASVVVVAALMVASVASLGGTAAGRPTDASALTAPANGPGSTDGPTGGDGPAPPDRGTGAGGGAESAGDGGAARESPGSPGSDVGVTGSADASTERSPAPPVEAAVDHVASYESDSFPATTVITDTADLVATAADTLDVDRETVWGELEGLSVGPPGVTGHTDAGTVVRLYSWTTDRGIVLRWNVTVADGQAVRREATVVRSGLGTTVGVEEFAPPKDTVVVKESLAAAGATADVPNLTVSDNFVTVFENGTAETTTISLGDFGAGNEQVKVNITIEGTRIRNRSGNRLVVSTDGEGNGSVRFTPPATLYSGRTCIDARSPSETVRWCITDRTTGDDNNTMDDERGLLTIEEAESKTTSGAGGSITYVAKYTDQNLDSAISTDSELSQTESDRQFVVDNVLNKMTTIYQNQVVKLGFDKYVGTQFEGDKRLPVTLNDGKWDFHTHDDTQSFLLGSQNGGPKKSISYNLRYGYTRNLTSHTRTVLAHEHFHSVQYSYYYYGSNRHSKDWYMEGQALFSQTLADPAIMQDSRSAFYLITNRRYLDNPDRTSLSKFAYDYAIFWLYMYKKLGIDAIERSIVELNNVSGSDVDTYGPKALDRAIEVEPGYDSYREFMIDFHTAVYRATEAHDSRPFNTTRDWTRYMYSVDTEQVEFGSSGDLVRKTGTVNPGGADYYELFDTDTSAYDGTYVNVNRSDLYVRTIRAGQNHFEPEKYPNAFVRRGNLTSAPRGQLPVTPNNTVYHGSRNDEIGVVVMTFGDGGNKSYNVTLRSNTTDHRLRHRLDEQGEQAIYLIPVNKNKPAGLTGQYGSQGDVFVSVHPSSLPHAVRTGGPRDLTADLTLAAGTAGTGSVKRLNTTRASNKTELVAPVDDSASAVWKLTVTERSTTPVDPGRYFVRSNYLAGNTSSGAPTDQLFGMPTETELPTGTAQAGSISDPKPITLRVNVSNGDTRYQHAPFPTPDASHFLVEIDGTPVTTGRITVVPLGPGQFELVVRPPTQQTAGTYRICVAFTETKFGVTETTPSTCGSITYEPDLGTPVIVGPPIIQWFDPTPVIETTVTTGQDNDTVSLVTTSQEGSTTAVQSTRLDGNRSELRAATSETLGSLDPAGQETDIAAGLEAGLTQVRESSAGRHTVTLVSRGNATGSVEAIVDAYVDADVPIHAVAVVEDANAELLRRVAERTGGTFHRASTQRELAAAFSRIDAVERREPVLDRLPATPGEATETLDPGGSISRTFHAGGSTPVVLRVDLGGAATSDTGVSLADPSGNAVTADTDQEGVEYLRTGGTVIYRLEDPRAGTWTYTVANANGTASSEVAAQVTSQSRTALTVSTNRGTGRLDGGLYAPGEIGQLTTGLGGGNYTAGQPIHVGASFVDTESDAQVTATVALPNGATERVTLESRGNGSYTALLGTGEGDLFNSAGRYTAMVRAQYDDVVRYRRLTWRVVPRPFRPTLEFGDASIRPGGSAQMELEAASLPDGARSLDATVCVRGDTGSGAIQTVTSPLGTVAVQERTDRCLRFTVTDENGAVEPGAEVATLATVTLSETVPGTADVALSLERTDEILVDDDGERVAVTARAGSLSVAPDRTTTATVVLDRTPHGLHAFNLTVDTPAPIVDVQAGVITDESFTVAAGGVGADRVRLRGIDANDQAGSFAEPVVLAEITYAGTATDATLSVHDLRNDNGSLQPRDPKGDPMDPDLVRLGEESSEPPAEEGAVAALTAEPTVVTANPGEEATLTFNLTNTGTADGNATAVNLTQWPTNWGVTSADGTWQPEQRTWLSLGGGLAAGETFTANLTLTVPDNASTGDYSMAATGKVTPSEGDAALATVSVEEPTEFNTSTYDTDGDGTVSGDFTGVVTAIEDYNTDQLTFTQVIEVIAAYNN